MTLSSKAIKCDDQHTYSQRPETRRGGGRAVAAVQKRTNLRYLDRSSSTPKTSPAAISLDKHNSIHLETSCRRKASPWMCSIKIAGTQSTQIPDRPSFCHPISSKSSRGLPINSPMCKTSNLTAAVERSYGFLGHIGIITAILIQVLGPDMISYCRLPLPHRQRDTFLS